MSEDPKERLSESELISQMQYVSVLRSRSRVVDMLLNR